jgi:hypothetical protein
MGERVLKIWYDKDLDLLEVFWGEEPNYYEATDNEWVLADVDMQGNLQGFQIEGVTQLGDGLLEIPVPAPDNLEKAKNLKKASPER